MPAGQEKITAIATQAGRAARRSASAFRALLSLMLVGVGLLTMSASDAAAGPKRAAYLVIDAETGHVLRSSRATLQRHPASLTKMMTLYLVFEALEAGELRPEQTLVTSRHAASMPPSELGLRRGDRISVRTAIRAAAVKSANDAAVVLAEAVGGTESQFAELMTAKARVLGMPDTVFRNATGLTHRRHLSTARDMAILARRLHADFPDYYHLFSRRRVRAHGRIFNATNRLLGRDGVDGIKTGYTRAAGFNLAGSALRSGDRVIVAFLGGRSSRGRNAAVAELLDDGFRRLKRKRRLGLMVAVNEAPRPRLRPDPNHSEAPEPAPGELRQIAAMARRHPVGRARPSLISGWSVQVGAFLSRGAADAQLAEVFGLDTPSLRTGYRNVVSARLAVADDATPRTVHRVRFTGLSEADARDACRMLATRRQPCALVPPLGWDG